MQAGAGDSLITPFVIKPGYLPEQPASHVPGESARALFPRRLRTVLFRRDEREQGDRVSFSEHGRAEVRTRERREEREADREPETWREEVENGAGVDHSGERGLRCILAPMSTNEQLGRQDQSY